MARTKPEREVQRDIIKYIKLQGWYVIKVIKGNENGIHDLLACIDGKFVSIEVKAEQFAKDPFKQASEWQKRHLKAVNAAGGISMVVATLEQFKTALTQDLSSYDFLD